MRAASRGFAGAVAAFAVLSFAPSVALGQLDADALKTYGGRYAVDCANPASPHIDVTATALNVEQGTRRMTGTNLQSAVSYFGNSEPPKGFMVALLSEVRGGLELTGMMWTDRQGPYIKLDGSPKVRAALGALVDAHFHDCNPARAQRVLGQQANDAADSKRDAALRRQNEKGEFGTAYRRALGPLARQPWLAEIAGYPESLDKTVQVQGASYRFGQACKPHDCYDNNMVVLHAPSQGVVYGKAVVALRPSYFGAPPPAVQRELDRLWLATFRQGR